MTIILKTQSFYNDYIDFKHYINDILNILNERNSASTKKPSVSEQIQKQLPEVFCKKGVLRYFIKFIGKQLCQSLLFNKVADLSRATLLL